MYKTLICVGVFTLMLGGCGGSDDSDGAAPPAPISQAEYEIFSRPMANKTGTVIEQDGDSNNPHSDYVYIRREGNAIKVTYRDVANIDALGEGAASLRTFSAGIGDFTDAGDYKRAAIPTNVTALDGKPVAVTDIIEVGGKKLGLQYSDFGMWKTTMTHDGTTYMTDPEILNDHMEDNAHKAVFAADINPRTFTGKAMGTAREFAQGNTDDVRAEAFKELYGDAAMTIGSGSSNATLDLVFPGFYDMQFRNLQLKQDGEFEELGGNLQVGALTITDNSNDGTVVIDLTRVNNQSNTSIDIDGQFFGPNKNTITEATGEVEYVQRDNGRGNRVDVDITFGVKQ